MYSSTIPLSRGPGLYKARRATISSNLSAFKFFRTSFIPEDSIWKIPLVKPFERSSYILGSFKSAVLISLSISLLFILMKSFAFFMTVNVFKPKKSNFTKPNSSTAFISYCVTISSLEPL